MPGKMAPLKSRGELEVSEKVYPVPSEWAATAHADEAAYHALYARSLADPEGFWRDAAQRLDWMKEAQAAIHTIWHDRAHPSRILIPRMAKP